jgi:hypothetical protein
MLKRGKNGRKENIRGDDSYAMTFSLQQDDHELCLLLT